AFLDEPGAAVAHGELGAARVVARHGDVVEVVAAVVVAGRVVDLVDTDVLGRAAAAVVPPDPTPVTVEGPGPGRLGDRPLRDHQRARKPVEHVRERDVVALADAGAGRLVGEVGQHAVVAPGPVAAGATDPVVGLGERGMLVVVGRAARPHDPVVVGREVPLVGVLRLRAGRAGVAGYRG